MINYIKGELVYIGESNIIVDNNGIGYSISVSASTVYKLPHINSEIKIFTFMDVKEGGIQLYGFVSKEELDMFALLITVGGVGPKGALALLGELSPSDIVLAISSQDKNTLSVGKGIGKKTAERIILDLKDKVSGISVSSDMGSVSAVTSGYSDEKNDAIAGLVSLGFTRSEAARAVEAVYSEGMDSGKIISAALKRM